MVRNLKVAFADCIRFREVLYNILSQDLKVKYKRTFLGYLWSLLNPILQLVVLTFVFSHMMRMGGMKDYTLYLFSGILVYNFFSGALSASATSILENEGFIKKIYLPKILFPLSRVLMREVDFLFSLVALGILLFAFGLPFKPTLAFLPFAIVIFTIFTLGLSCLVALATVYFRDVQYLLGVFLQLIYFATPILYPVQMLPEPYRPYLALNPLVLQIGLFQKLIYYGENPPLVEWTQALGMALVTFLVGAIALLWWEDDLVFRM